MAQAAIFLDFVTRVTEHAIGLGHAMMVMPFLVAVSSKAPTASAVFTVGTSIRKAPPSGKRAAELGISNKSPTAIRAS